MYKRVDNSISSVQLCVNSMMEPHNSSNEGEASDFKTETDRAASPAPSNEFVKRTRSMDMSIDFRSGPVPSDPKTETQSESTPPSPVSMKSDSSMHKSFEFSSGPEPSDPNFQMKPANISKDRLDSVFKELEHKIISQLTRFKMLLKQDCTAFSESEVENEEEESSEKDRILTMTLHILKKMNEEELANKLQIKLAPSCHRNHKSKLRDKCQTINEGISKHGNPALLNELYTELYITEGESGVVINEHEVKLIEMLSRKHAAQETATIKLTDIFKPLSKKDKLIRTVLTKGAAGIGKTVSVQKFILEWSKGSENQDILFVFPLPFRELNLIKDKKYSLMKLLHDFFPETQELQPIQYTYYKILFIFDGLDESQLPLDFQNNVSLCNVEESTSVDVLLTNLIKGNLLRSALLWITSRAAAANQIPPEYIDQVTEVRGFSDPQKEEYFRKRISDQRLATRIITHIKKPSLRSLYTMCHIPVFCWIAATVLERMLGEEDSGEIPKTLTQMFTYFLIFQIKHKGEKSQDQSGIHLQKTKQSILALGKLAFQQLQKRNTIFYEKDLNECGIDVSDVTVYSGLCIQIDRQYVLPSGNVFSFVHLTIQEFLAALYAFIEFSINNRNVLENQYSAYYWLFKFFSRSTVSDFLNSTVDKVLESENGDLDLFLRFLVGLSLESNQSLLYPITVLSPTGRSISSKEETVKFIKKKIVENAYPEKTINLFHCLNEMNDQSLIQEVQQYPRRGGDQHLCEARFSPGQWSALGFVLLNSEEKLDVFDLRKYNPSEECLLRLLPVVETSRKAVLTSCNLGAMSCHSLGSALKLANSLLRELDLSNNDLQDSGVKLLSAGLKSSHCKLEILRLSGCLITEEGCSSLASALSSNPSHLKELDLSYNHPGDVGEKLLSDIVHDPHSKLETLKVEHAGKNRIIPGLRKYGCKLTLDPNTAHTRLSLSKESTKVSCVWRQQSNPNDPERFDGFQQVLCRESLSGRCYWEAEWSGAEGAAIAVACKEIGRKGHSDACRFGFNEKSWALKCFNDCYSVYHNKIEIVKSKCPSHSKRVGVFLDWPAGILSFYSVCANTHTLLCLHTFQTTFTEPLYAGFRVNGDESSFYLCEIDR